MIRRFLLSMALAAIPLAASAQQMGFMQIGGEVVTMNGAPIPGCQVMLFNQQVGASTPVFTGLGGDYYFSSVPTNVASLYNIQVEFQGNVIYRGIIQHPGVQAPIVIPIQ